MAAPAIGRRSRWAPPAGAALDWNHPLSQGLVGFWTGDGTDLTGKLRLVPSGVSRGVGEFGDGAAMVTADANMSAGALDAHKIQVPVTLVAVVTEFATRAFLPMFGVAVNNGELPRLSYMLYYTDSGRVYCRSNNAGSIVDGTVSTSPLPAGPNVVVGVFTGTGMELWLNGRRDRTDAVTLNPTYPGTCWVTSGVKLPYIAGRIPNSIFHAGSMYARVLSGNEIAALYADPYCMLRT